MLYDFHNNCYYSFCICKDNSPIGFRIGGKMKRGAFCSCFECGQQLAVTRMLT